MATYVNDLRLKEIATGDEAGTWGTSTNTNLELIAEAFSFGTEAITTNADTHTTTIADGSTDPGRSIFLKYTGTLDSACTITIGPNTVSKLWFIENATSGSQNIIIKQGSGATITVPNGQVKAIYSDGAGSGGAMVDAFQDLSVPDLFVDDDLTIGDDLVFSSDSAVITFGADGDTTLTHTDGSGLTLNSTNKIMFNDASQFIQGSSATVLSLGATDEIDLTATAIDVNGTMDISGALTGTTATFGSITTNEDQSGLLTLGRFSSGTPYSLVRPSTNATGLEVRTFAGNALARFLNSGVTELYHNGSLKLSTGANGIGIGTSSPSALVDLGTSTGQKLLMYASSNIKYGMSIETSEYRMFAEDQAVLTFGHMARSDGSTFTERMRIDTSGNVLVGKTSTAFGTAGLRFAPTGAIDATVSGDGSLFLNRLSSDGEIAYFYKDGTNIGTIGVSGGNNIYISGSASNHAGLTFATDAILPTRQGAIIDNVTDLGSSTERFKDIYLSGGAYLGGTGSANKLDYYEETTWTPSQSGVTLSVTTATAIRVGSLVTINARIVFPSNSDSTVVAISGLPFARATHYQSAGGLMHSNVDLPSGYTQLAYYLGGSSINLYACGDGVAFSAMRNNNLSGADIIFTISYETDA